MTIDHERDQARRGWGWLLSLVAGGLMWWGLLR